MKLLSLLMICSVFSTQAMLTPSTKEHIQKFKPGAFRDENGFAYRHKGSVTRVNAYDVDKQLRQLPSSKFNAASKYIVANKMNNGDYTLRLQPKGLGGGPWAAMVGYWTVKIGAYVGVGVAVTGALAATGGAVVTTMAASAAGTATGATIATGIGAGIAESAIAGVAIGSTGAGVAIGGATATAAIIGGAEAGALTAATLTGVSSVATLGTAGASTTGAVGIASATAAGIESAAMAAFWAGLALPTP